MSILFNNVPNDAQLNLTAVEVSKEKTTTSLAIIQQRLMLVGQCDPSKVAAGDDGKPVQIFSADKAAELFGVGYQIHQMAEKCFKNCGSTDVIAFPLRLAAGTASIATLTVTAAPTVAGTLAIYISGVRIPVSLSTGLSVTAVGDAIEAAINAKPELPCTASNAAGTVTITCKWYGESGDDLQISLTSLVTDSTPTGLVITETSPAFTGGVGTVDISTALAHVTEASIYTLLVHPFQPSDTANMTSIEVWEDTRWHPRVVRGFCAIGAVRGDWASPLTTQIAARNSFVSAFFGQQDIPQSAAEVAAAVGGMVGRRAGIDPSRQFHNEQLIGLTAPYDETSHWGWDKRDTALKAGLSVAAFSAGRVVADSLVTTYTTTDGAADAPQVDRYVNTVMVLIAVTYDRQQHFLTVWSQAKLGNDGQIFPPGQLVMTPLTMKSELLSRYSLYVGQGWVQEIEEYEKTIIVQRNAGNSQRLDSQDQLLIAPNLRITAMKTTYAFA